MNLKNVLIIGLIAAVVIIVAFPDILPFGNRGGTGISLGYVLEDGTEVEIPTDGSTVTMYRDPLTFSWYSDALKTQKITGVWGQLNVTATTDESVGTVSVLATRKVEYEVVSSTGTRTWTTATAGVNNITLVTPNTFTELTNTKYTLSLPSSIAAGSPEGARSVRYTYDVTATAGTKTATTQIVGTFGVHWYQGTLSITGVVSRGTG